jgi:hypothetical protein
MQVPRNSAARAAVLFLSIALLVGLFFGVKHAARTFFETSSTTSPDNRLRDLREDSNLPPQPPSQKKTPPVRVIPKNDKGLLQNVQISQADIALEQMAANDSLWLVWFNQMDLEDQTARLVPTVSICNLDRSPVFANCAAVEADSINQCLQKELGAITQRWLNEPSPLAFQTEEINEVDRVYLEIHVDEEGIVSDVAVLNFPVMGDLRPVPELVVHFPKMRPAVRKGQPVKSVLFLEVSFEAEHDVN